MGALEYGRIFYYYFTAMGEAYWGAWLVFSGERFFNFLYASVPYLYPFPMYNRELGRIRFNIPI